MTPEQHRNQADLLRHSSAPEAKRRADVHERLAAAIEARSATHVAMAGDAATFNEGDHPRDADGQFTAGAGGSSGGAKPAARPRAPSRGQYAGQYVENAGSPRQNHHATATRVLSQPANRGIHYRRMLTRMIREAPKFGGGDGQVRALKGRLIESLAATIDAENARGRTAEADRAAATMGVLIQSLIQQHMGARTPPAPAPAPPVNANNQRVLQTMRERRQARLERNVAEAAARMAPPAAAKPGSIGEKLQPYGTDQKGIATYEKYVKMEPNEFANTMLGDMKDHADNVKIQKGYGDDTLIMRANFPGGGSMVREIDFKEGSVYHAYLVIPEAQRKAGKSILKNQIDTYRKLGLKSVGVTANIDVGAYAWAKYGYIPTQDSWNGLREQLSRTMTQRGIDNPEIKEILANRDPKSIWKLVDSKATMQAGGETTTIAKNLLTGGRAPSWKGKLDLSNKDSMKRFDEYVGKQK